MLKPINNSMAQIWNERFEKCMTKKKWSQRQFIAEYKKKYHTGSQSDVSKWMHVGDVDQRTNKGRGFPEFETMKNIADILGVSVGYLIGETDCETFEMERASQYVGLSSEAISAIRDITLGKAIPPFYKYSDPQYTAALEQLLMNTSLVEYLGKVVELANAVTNAKQNNRSRFDRIVEKIPESIRNSVISLWEDSEEAVKNGIEPNETLWAFVNILDDEAAEEALEPDYMRDGQVKLAEYALMDAQNNMMNIMKTGENLSKISAAISESK